MNSKAFTFPVLDDPLSIPELLYFHLQHNPDQPAFVFSKDRSQTVVEISYKQFACACRRVPPAVGVDFNGSNRAVVALLAHTDALLYQTMILGIMNAGHVPFPISPRNTATAIVHLLQKTSCHHVVATRNTLGEIIDSVESEIRTTHPDFALTITEAPVLGELFPGLLGYEEDDAHPSPVGFKQSPDDVAIYVHSSGSTGLPKAIPKTHRAMLDFNRFESSAAFRNRTPRLVVAGMQAPAFHAMGVGMQLLFPLYSGAVVALFPPIVENPATAPTLPDPDNVLDHVQRTHCSSLIAVPAFLQTWSHEKRYLDILARLDFVGYGAGALGSHTGDRLVANGIKLRTFYGATEIGCPAGSSMKEEDREDWEYMQVDKACNPRWVPYGNDAYELQVLRSDTYNPSVHNLPDVEGYTTSDLFKRHPTKEYLWKIIGRVDDVIIHSSGEKTVPAPMEGIIVGSPYVQAVVMFGHARDQPGVLIEPSASYAIDVDDGQQLAQFKDLVWPIIEEANKVAPAFSKVFKELIIIASKSKPLIYTGKGTLSRKASVQLYTSEIEHLYATLASIPPTELVEVPDNWDKESLNQWILDQVRHLCPGRTVTRSGNLFEEGLDSLSATILRRRITGALQFVNTAAAASVLELITQTTIYNHPTVDSLSQYLVEVLRDPNFTGTSKCQVDIIEDMISKYSFEVHPRSLAHSAKKGGAHDAMVVLVTGTTGYLGSHVLQGLLLASNISKIYTLNRSSSGASSAERHMLRFRDKGLDENLLKSEKLVHLESDFSSKNLGLPELVYAELSASVNVIIHIAWRLDFNLSLASFESNIRGTYNLVELARSSLHAENLKFIFTSSIGSASSWDPALGPIPEELLLDAKYAVGNGYGESKYVADRIIATAGLNSVSLRIGQITGGEQNGAWATTDWVPGLVKSSTRMNGLPSVKGNISWLPMKAVSDCILDLVAYSSQYSQVLNIVHPHRIKWDTVMEYTQGALERERGVVLPLISFQEWVSILETHCASSNSDEVVRVPAIKIHQFYRHWLQGELVRSPYTSQAFGSSEYSTAVMQEISSSLANLPPLSKEDVYKWVRYWNGVGLFD